MTFTSKIIGKNQKEVNIKVYIIVEKESTDNHTVNSSSGNTDDQTTGEITGRKKVHGLIFPSSFTSDQGSSGQLPSRSKYPNLPDLPE